ICLAAGFLTRLVAAPIIGFLMVAIVTYHWQFGFAWENRGIEYPLFWAIVVFHFLIRGGGAWSIDALIGREGRLNGDLRLHRAARREKGLVRPDRSRALRLYCRWRPQFRRCSW